MFVIAIPFVLKNLIQSGVTNGESIEVETITGTTNDIPAWNWQVHKYLSEHPEDADDVVATYKLLNKTGHSTRFPKGVLAVPCFSYILKGIESREGILKNIKLESQRLGIDEELVISSMIGEQFRIACNSQRDSVKKAIVGTTPRRLVSYDISLWVWGVKVSTAREIFKHADARWTASERFLQYDRYSDGELATAMSTDDYLQAALPTNLVKNILVRWANHWYDISGKPGVVWTLYNMGNNEKKKPNANPKLGWAVIRVGARRFTYGELSAAVYWYRKIFINNN